MFCSYVSDNNANIQQNSRVQLVFTESLVTMVLKDRASFAPAPEKLERAPFAILSLKECKYVRKCFSAWNQSVLHAQNG